MEARPLPLPLYTIVHLLEAVCRGRSREPYEVAGSRLSSSQQADGNIASLGFHDERTSLLSRFESKVTFVDVESCVAGMAARNLRTLSCSLTSCGVGGMV